MTEVGRIARALGYGPREEFTLEELVERATFLHQFCLARYRANACTPEDLEAARLGLSDPAVGRVLDGLNRDASRHATTEPGELPPESDPYAEPLRLPQYRPLPRIEEP